jgi:hypothetical protein
MQVFSARLFKILCEELDIDHTVLTLHTEVRWLSRGGCLSEILIFFQMFLLLCRAPASSVTLCNNFLMTAEIGTLDRLFHKD